MQLQCDSDGKEDRDGHLDVAQRKQSSPKSAAQPPSPVHRTSESWITPEFTPCAALSHVLQHMSYIVQKIAPWHHAPVGCLGKVKGMSDDECEAAKERKEKKRKEET